MIQSLNTKVDLTINATSYTGLNCYGKMMIGDKSIEFYDDRDITKFIQIPWEEIDYIAASVLFKKWIPRFAIFTKKNGYYSFSTRNNKLTLNTIKNYVNENKLRKSLSFFDVCKRGFLNLFRKKSN